MPKLYENAEYKQASIMRIKDLEVCLVSIDESGRHIMEVFLVNEITRNHGYESMSDILARHIFLY